MNFRKKKDLHKELYLLIHHTPIKHKIPQQLPDLTRNNQLIQIEIKIWFLGILDEHIYQDSHICTLETKIAKNIGVSYRSKNILDRASIKTIYFSHIHSHPSYGNIVWANIYISKLHIQLFINIKLTCTKISILCIKIHKQ